MSAWRRKALELLPELRQSIEPAETPMALWIELHLRFDEAMAAGEWQRVRRLLDLAAWCISEQSGPLPNDTSSAVVVAFYEHLPLNRKYWEYFPRWFSRSQFNELLPAFSYHLSEKDLAELKSAYASAA